MDADATGTMEVAALGRPFSLGMLYDCRKDSLIPGKNSHVEILNASQLDNNQNILNIEMGRYTAVEENSWFFPVCDLWGRENEDLLSFV